MRVLVELFDKERIKNVLASCVFQPETTVFLCDKSCDSTFEKLAMVHLLARRGLKTKIRFYHFDAADPAAIRRVLAAVLTDYPGCVFDFTGGGDLVLLVAGSMLVQAHLPGFYVDIPRRRVLDLGGCQALAERFTMPIFSADDVFALSGATIQGSGHFSSAAGPGEAFEEDALAVFDIVMKNPRAWSQFVSWLQAFCAGTAGSATVVEGPRGPDSRPHSAEGMLRTLHKAGQLSHLQLGDKRLSFTFKSALHRRCLLIEGVWLELYCYIVARRSGYFDDVRTSIVVDWDGVENKGGGTKNEVDVFLVQGVKPVFISCKMSPPSPLALSEIGLLAAKFGGGLARVAVLTAAKLDAGGSAIAARAADLGIALLDGEVVRSGGLAMALRALAG